MFFRHLDNNFLTGTIPSLVFAQMRRLYVLLKHQNETKFFVHFCVCSAMYLTINSLAHCLHSLVSLDCGVCTRNKKKQHGERIWICFCIALWITINSVALCQFWALQDWQLCESTNLRFKCTFLFFSKHCPVQVCLQQCIQWNNYIVAGVDTSECLVKEQNKQHFVVFCWLFCVAVVFDL